MNLRFAVVLACAALSVGAIEPAVAQTPAAPVRHLVYTFTWGTTNNTEVHSSGMRDDSGDTPGASTNGSASGIVNYSAGTQDKGTITVDVLKEQPDRGLVINISEQARDQRSAPVAMCVVFGNTNLVCDPNKKITAEELTLMRFLGTTFIDPTQMDAHNHWQIAQNNPGIEVTADYTITKNDAGKMTIDEVRVLKGTGAKPSTANINSTIGYDFSKLVPTSVTEFLIQRSEAGEQYQTVKTETVLQLESDTLTKG